MLLSLYSGCGGMDLGFEAAGFEVGLAYDIRPHSIASWNGNRPGAPRGHVADLSSIGLKDMDRNFGSRFVPSGVIGGPPCQGFSRANHFRSNKDPRRKHVRHFFSIALRFHRCRRPLDFILMENVPAVEAANDGSLLRRELERLRTYGLYGRTFILDAARYSVPQHRKRLFVLVLPNRRLLNEQWSPPSGTDARRTVGDAISRLPDPTQFRRGINPGSLPFHPNHWYMVPRSRRFFDGSLVAGDSSRRSFKTLDWDAPSITASYGNREVHVHPDGKRRLSVLEAMRLQGFPDEYILEGTLSAQINQVSEAVPPPLAEAIAMSIRSLIKEPQQSTNDQANDYVSSEVSAAAL